MAVKLPNCLTENPEQLARSSSYNGNIEDNDAFWTLPVSYIEYNLHFETHSM